MAMGSVCHRVCVHVRDPGRPDEPSSGHPSEVTFRVPIGVIVIKFGLAALVTLGALVTGDRLALFVGLAAALALAAVGLRDVLARDRLRADPTGIDVVRGYLGRVHLDWTDVEHLRVDERLRLGVRSQLLEVDADTELYLFSRYDLGVEPSVALESLLQTRRERH
jgi:hypothetical protein